MSDKNTTHNLNDIFKDDCGCLFMYIGITSGYHTYRVMYTDPRCLDNGDMMTTHPATFMKKCNKIKRHIYDL